ncbi:hypothetical protein J6590_050371 [Homalodisca vitripennis]|nr:hypothetical protein J6590_093003 [Homalodisca vitripennis]KAG8336171.1 hypothetical protein J6590_050371 [Homalodisca vitripennis]
MSKPTQVLRAKVDKTRGQSNEVKYSSLQKYNGRGQTKRGCRTENTSAPPLTTFDATFHDHSAVSDERPQYIYLLPPTTLSLSHDTTTRRHKV